MRTRGRSPGRQASGGLQSAAPAANHSATAHSVGVPSELLERRPIRRCQTPGRLGERAGRTRQNRLLSHGRSAGIRRPGERRYHNVVSGPSAFWAVGGQVLYTIFDAGRRRAQNDQAKEAYVATGATYRQTVLTAFQQVEDNLAALRILEQEAQVQAKAVDAAERSLSLSNTRYEGGVTNYLEVITAQNAALSDEVTSVNILGRRMASAVLLIEALGGGWDRSSLPQRPECCGKLMSSNVNP